MACMAMSMHLSTFSSNSFSRYEASSAHISASSMSIASARSVGTFGNRALSPSRCFRVSSMNRATGVPGVQSALRKSVATISSSRRYQGVDLGSILAVG